jgi:hypothetical protein
MITGATLSPILEREQIQKHSLKSKATKIRCRNNENSIPVEGWFFLLLKVVQLYTRIDILLHIYTYIHICMTPQHSTRPGLTPTATPLTPLTPLTYLLCLLTYLPHHPAPNTQYPAPSTQYPAPSTQQSAPSSARSEDPQLPHHPLPQQRLTRPRQVGQQQCTQIQRVLVQLQLHAQQY